VDRQVAALQRGLASQGKPLDEYLKENRQTEVQLRANVATMKQWSAYAAKKVTAADVQKYFNDNREFFDKTTVRASHVVIRVSPDAPPAEREEAKKKLLAVRQEIVAKKLTFAEAAMKHSQCPSGPKGGDLDFIARKWMVEEPFAKAAFALKVGELSDLVTTDFGVHLITVTDRKAGTPVAFEAVAEEARECVLEELRQRTLMELRQAAKVEIKLP
jgi:peptidyl-prolyl cis-trans isomerase C